MLQYFLDFYMLYCPRDCDKKDCPKDDRNNIQSPRGCPRQKKYLHARGDLGVLTKDELEFLKRENEDPDIIIFRKAKDISLKTLEDQREHLGLVKKFAENKKVEERLPPYLYFQLKRVRELQRLAEVRRNIKKEALATITPEGNVGFDDELPTSKELTAEEKLRTYLKEKREDIVKTNTELDAIIGEKPGNVRKTRTWKLIRCLIKVTKKHVKIGQRLNNNRVDGPLRERIEDELEDAKQELELAKFSLHQHLNGDSADVNVET